MEEIIPVMMTLTMMTNKMMQALARSYDNISILYVDIDNNSNHGNNDDMDNTATLAIDSMQLPIQLSSLTPGSSMLTWQSRLSQPFIISHNYPDEKCARQNLM